MPDGNLQFLGRSDRQIKRRGFRIEPGEIEATALTDPKVKEAVVSYRNEKLTLYYTLAEGFDEEISEELFQTLAKELPEYMLPDGYMRLDAMPLSLNGKVDTGRLPAFVFTSDTFVPPETDLEKLLCEKICEVLHIERIGIRDDFFEMGGNSLNAAVLAEMLGEEYELRDIYLGRTVEGILRFSSQNRKLCGFEKRSAYPIPEEQKKYFFSATGDYEVNPRESSANVPSLLRLPQEMDLEVLREKLKLLIDNHPYLKVRFARTTDPAGSHQIEAIRDDSLPAKVSLLYTDRLDRDSLIRPFDLLGEENLYRVTLFDVLGREKYLFYDFHHILVDGASLTIAARDMKALLEGKQLVPERVTGYEVGLEEEIRREEEGEEIRGYFQKLLRDFPRDGEVWPASMIDREKDAWWSEICKSHEDTDLNANNNTNGSTSADTETDTLPNPHIFVQRTCAVDMEHVQERCRELHITETMFFNAAFACLVGELNGLSQALYTTVYENREMSALSGSFALLCRTVPVCLKVTEDTLSSPEFLHQLRGVMANMGRGGIFSYEEICRWNQIRMPSVSMIYYDHPFIDAALFPGIQAEDVASFDTMETLMVKITHASDDSIRLHFTFYFALQYSQEEMEAIAGRLDEIISRM